jgi:tRNA(Arg) A34 adenosine deaminase TadA
VTPTDLDHLRRCIALAHEARAAGDDPFGSVLVGGDGAVVAQARNRVRTDRDVTAHPELTLARHASRHLDRDARAVATVYTSGEHCPMCAVAHAYAGIGRLVFALSAAELAGLTGTTGWGLSVRELYARRGLTIRVEGPAAELRDEVSALHLGAVDTDVDG